ISICAACSRPPSAVIRARRIIIFGSTFSGQAGTQLPLRVQTAIQPSASGVLRSPRSTASTPGTTDLPSLAGAAEYFAIGQTSKHLPQRVQAERMRSTSLFWNSFRRAPMSSLRAPEVLSGVTRPEVTPVDWIVLDGCYSQTGNSTKVRFALRDDRWRETRN